MEEMVVERDICWEGMNMANNQVNIETIYEVHSLEDCLDDISLLLGIKTC